MSNGNYPSPAVAYQGVHTLIGYGTVLTAALRLHHWTYGLVAVLLFALVKEFAFALKIAHQWVRLEVAKLIPKLQ
jgi:hypothetical protein